MIAGASSSTLSLGSGSGGAGEAGPSQPASPRRPDGQTRRTPRSNSALYADEDDSVVMRDRAHRNSGAAADREEVTSIGKAGGVSGGVTRPKRRLSSLPSLSHPFHSRGASSPTTPNGTAFLDPANLAPSYPSHPQSTYHALQGGLSAPLRLGGQTGPGGYSGRVLDEKLHLNLGGGKGKEKDGSPRIFGIELKWISLITLALQNALLTIIMHYSRITAAPSKTYSAASAVLINELLKGTVSVLMALRGIDQNLRVVGESHAVSEKTGQPLEPLPSKSSFLPSIFHSSRRKVLRQAVLSRDCFKLAVPAVLYVIQNNLQYMAASNLDVATFQVTYQMKILTTAFFSVVMLRKRLSNVKWAALVMLAVGVAIVQLQTTSAPSHARASPPIASAGVNAGGHHAALRSEIPDITEDMGAIGAEEVLAEVAKAAAEQVTQVVMSPIKGFLAVTAACMTSGLAGVYFELILKTGGGGGGGGGSGAAAPATTAAPDLWVRNTQLSLFSLLPALAPIIFTPAGPDGVGWLGRVMASFSHYNGWAVGTVLTQTFGGLITAVVIRYSDNIMKGFATSLSIIISFLASVALFNYPITTAFVVGSSIVLAATLLYNKPEPPVSSSRAITRKEVAVAPGSPIGSRAPILGEPEKPSRTSSVISLLGLASSMSSRPASRAPSRGPSQTDLRAVSSAMYGSQANLHPSSSFLGMTGASQRTGATPHVYAASAPGTPYVYSTAAPGGHSVSALYGLPSDHASGVSPLPLRARGLPPPAQPRRSDSSSSSTNGDSSSAMSANGSASASASVSGRSSGESSTAPKIGGPGYFVNGPPGGPTQSKAALRVDIS